MTDAEVAMNCRAYITRVFHEAFDITPDLLVSLQQYDLPSQYYIAARCFAFFNSKHKITMMSIFDMLSNDKTEEEMTLIRDQDSENKIALIKKIIKGCLHLNKQNIKND